MKKFFLFCLLLCSALLANAQAPFITKWTFDAPATSIQFHSTTAGPVDYTWSAAPSGASGSSSFSSEDNEAVSLDGLTIAAGDVVTLTMQPENLRTFRQSVSNDQMADKLTDVTQWGDVAWEEMDNAFLNCVNLNITATDTPDLSAVAFMRHMFDGCTVLNSPSNIGTWNMQSVEDMSYMFNGAAAFNQDIGSWSTDNLWYTNNMFVGASAFNQNISGWNMANVEYTREMFLGASAFNQDLSSWNVGNAFEMQNMFANATAFNQNIGSWTLNPFADMTGMLDNCGMDCSNYTATLSGWYTGNPSVVDMTLGASGRSYFGTAHDDLVNNRGWTITGDAPLTATPQLVAAGETIVTTQGCAADYANPGDKGRIILLINANGNANFLPTNVNVTVSNQFAGSPPSGVTTPSSFYENTGSGQTLRISRRLHTITPVQNLTYSTNGGVLVRVYYEDSELSDISDSGTLPAGTIAKSGWFKSSKHTVGEVLNDMSSSTITDAVDITPASSGVENGIAYAEFLMESFSTIGYYSATNPAALPVTLVSFEAKKAESSVILSWKTSMELNSSHFEVQHSRNAKNWTQIGTVPAEGGAHTYQFNDGNALQGLNYYRLKMIDMDGTSALSNIIDLEMQEGRLKLYPNPAEKQLSVSGLQGDEQFRLTDFSGRVLKRWSNTKGAETKIPVNQLPNGMYLLEINEANGQKTVKKFVKE